MLRLKVVHVITTISRGGAENQLYVLCKASTKMGLGTSIFYLKGDPELENDFREIGVECFSLKKPEGIKRLVTILINHKETLLHGHLPRAELLLATMKIVFRSKIIISKHNAEPFAPAQPRVVSRLLARFVNNQANAIIFISDAVRKFSFSNGEINKSHLEKSHIVHYAIDIADFDTRKDSKFNASRNDIFRIGSLSRLEKQKNLPILLEALAKIAYQGLPFECQIYGRGSLEVDLLRKIRALNLESKVKLMGFTNSNLEVLSQFDLFVLTSDYEGFGFVLLEAICLKVPIVASNSDAAVEVLGENSPSLFRIGDSDSLAEKIKEVMSNSKLAYEIVTHNAVRLERFSVEKMIISIMNIYQSVL